MGSPSLLLISRDDILAHTREVDGDRLFRLLSRLTRQGFQFLSTAPQPEEWYSCHDEGLLGPGSIRSRLSESGGTLDGVYYIPRSSLTQRRSRQEALNDILERYNTQAQSCFLFSSSRKFVRAASRMGIHATHLSGPDALEPALHALLEVDEPASSHTG
jgi:hypothetical protein